MLLIGLGPVDDGGGGGQRAARRQDRGQPPGAADRETPDERGRHQHRRQDVADLERRRLRHAGHDLTGRCRELSVAPERAAQASGGEVPRRCVRVPSPVAVIEAAKASDDSSGKTIVYTEDFLHELKKTAEGLVTGKKSAQKKTRESKQED